MKKNKLMALSVFSLCFSFALVAQEYVAPKVELRPQIPSKIVKSYEFGDHYKVETQAYENERKVASEEKSEREPSSWEMKKQKKVEEPTQKHEPEMDDKKFDNAPKPWLYNKRTHEAY